MLTETDNVAETKPGPEAIIERAQMAKRITSLLTVREMECLRLRSEELSYEEIADILGVRPGTVSALLTRAHKKLLAPDGDNRTLQGRTVRALHFLFQNGDSYSS
jgi:RNA polymerase sigma factor (sigma-70 family)